MAVTKVDASGLFFCHRVGIGKMMTIALAENGARKVYIVGRREDKLNELAAKYPKYGPSRWLNSFQQRPINTNHAAYRTQCR